MRRPTTIKALARREALWISAVAIGAALVALAVPLGVPWLRLVGLGVGLLGALARGVIALQRARVERRGERVEADRRLRSPAGGMSAIDPLTVGVDPAAQTILAGGALPEYLARPAVDAALRAALTEAIEGTGPWLVVVVGASKVGKSRSLFEALRHCPAASDLEFVAPIDQEALTALLSPEQGLPRVPGPAVLWLDDLEPFLNDGVTLTRLREWRAGRVGRIVVGAYGGKGSDRLAGSEVGGLATVATDVLAHAREVSLRATTKAELDPLRERVPAAELDGIERHGLAAYLVAGPVLARKLATARHAPGDAPCPEGAAVVASAVDWARCGRTDPVGQDVLRRLWTARLPAGTADTDESFTAGLAWAVRPVAATIALLHQAEGYTAYDYVVRLTRDRPDAEPPTDQAWAAAIDTASDAQASAVADAAYADARLEDAAAALRRASTSPSPLVAARALYNQAAVHRELERPAEAVAAYDELIDAYGHDTDPALRDEAARALAEKGLILWRLDRPAEAVATYDRLIDAYGHDTDPGVRDVVEAVVAAREESAEAT